MARERKGAGSALVSIETQFQKEYIKAILQAIEKRSIDIKLREIQNNSLHRTHFYTQTLLHTKLLSTEAFTNKSFYIQKFLHIKAFIHRHFYTNTFTHRSLYTQTLLHTDPFTHRSCFYTQELLLHTNAYHSFFLILNPP